MKILLLGKNGQLGWELQRTFAPLGVVFAFDSSEFNLEDFASTRRTIRKLRPQIIVNSSAYTDVDRAESEPDKAFVINGTAPGILAEEAEKLQAIFIHFSTDYVFDGTKITPYIETDTPNPLNVYGKSKLAGEQAIKAVDGEYLILRTSWVYSLRGDNFVTKVLKWSRQQEKLSIVSDQVGSPTWSRMLAETTAQVLAHGREEIHQHRGVYHLAGNGSAGRLEWAKAILELDPNRHEQQTKEILPAQTSSFPSPAQRPLFSALSCNQFAATFNLQMPEWQDSLRLAMQG